METQTQQSEPLSGYICDLGKVDTSRPVPQAGTYPATFVKHEIKPNKEGTGRNWFFTFALTNGADAVVAQGMPPKTISPGYQLTECCVMQQGSNPNQPDWRVKIARIYDAVAGTNDETRPERLVFDSFVGRPLALTLKPEDDKEFGLQARIKKFEAVA